MNLQKIVVTFFLLLLLSACTTFHPSPQSLEEPPFPNNSANSFMPGGDGVSPMVNQKSVGVTWAKTF